MQVTGPYNIGRVNEAIAKMPDSVPYKSADLCADPGLICKPEAKYKDLRWLTALFYWNNDVQTMAPFARSLDAFVTADFDLAASVVWGLDLSDGASAVLSSVHTAFEAQASSRRPSSWQEERRPFQREPPSL